MKEFKIIKYFKNEIVIDWSLVDGPGLMAPTTLFILLFLSLYVEMELFPGILIAFVCCTLLVLIMDHLMDCTEINKNRRWN
jgi:hypothetical protein